MTASLFFASAAADLTPQEAERPGVYVLAAVIGLVVTGLIACAKHLRADLKRRD